MTGRFFLRVIKALGQGYLIYQYSRLYCTFHVSLGESIIHHCLLGLSVRRRYSA